MPTAPSNTEDRAALESQSGGQSENDRLAPHHTPSMDVEDIEDEDTPVGPSLGASSPCCLPSVTLKEVPDQDMPCPPQRWGPHLFAKPTCPSLFPRPHPDPMAADPEVFREAHWLDDIPISQRAEEEYFTFSRN
ncbi:hypothetical protein FRC06_000847 [Ceratobasidium sp. 370]|nr:hypothetical protein FRC06_000847 [Ceratobasidium sp. 370]